MFKSINSKIKLFGKVVFQSNGGSTPNINQVGSYYYTGTLTSGSTVLYSDNTLQTVANNIQPFVVSSNYYTTDGSGIVTEQAISQIGSYYYVGTLTSGSTVLHTDNTLTVTANNIQPFSNGSNYYTTDGSGIVTEQVISQIGSYYYVGTLTSGSTVLHTDNTLTVTADNIQPFVVSSNYYTTDGAGIVTTETVQTITLNGTAYYYVGTFENGTVLYSDNSLETPASAANDLPAGDLNNDTYNDTVSIGSGGVVTITYGENVTSSSITINNVAYYYAGTLTSGSTVLYSDEALTTVANATTYADEDADMYYEIDANHVYYATAISTVVINPETFYFLEPLTSGVTVLYYDNGLNNRAEDMIYVDEDADIFYEVDANGVYNAYPISTITINNVTYFYPGTLTSGVTVLFNDNVLSDEASATTYADEDADMYYEINENGVYSESVISNITINNVTYYYTGTLTSGVTVLYETNALDDIAGATAYADVDADIYYEISSSGVYSQSAILTITLGNTAYYYTGTFENGTVLYSNNSLETPASIENYLQAGDLNNDTYNDTVSIGQGGVVTINSGVPSLSITINNVTYYYAGALINGETVLYSDEALTTEASATTYADVDADMYYEIDANHVYYATAISTITINNVTYFCVGTVEDGVTLYSDNELETLASDTSYLEAGVAQYDITNGVLSIDPIQTISLNNANYYYIGTLTSGSTVLYTNNTLIDVLQNMYWVNTGTNTLYTTTESGVVSTENVYSNNNTGSVRYWAGTLANGTKIYFNNELTSIATDLDNENWGDLSDPPDQINDYVSTDSFAIATITYGT